MPAASRVGKNEALFREVNERMRELNEVFDGADSAELRDFVCECSRQACRDYIQLTLDEYGHVRSVSTHFLVAPGHVWNAEVEREVARHRRYWIVEKVGRAADAAN